MGGAVSVLAEPDPSRSRWLALGGLLAVLVAYGLATVPPKNVSATVALTDAPG